DSFGICVLFFHVVPTDVTELTATQQPRGASSITEDSISSWTENIKPSFTKKLKFQSVLEGEPVQLKCKLIACPPPTILWFHNNRSISKEHRRRICTDSRITSAVPSDEEGSQNFVTQEHDDLKIAFEVTEMPPRFINPICDMETPEGTTVMFECSLMGIPSPIISWFKGDRKIPHSNKKYFHSSDGDNHFLKISKVTTQDSGVYTCRAINVVGETLCRASLVVLSAKAFSGKTRGRELTAVSLGSAKVQPQKFDLMVGNTSHDGEQVSEIELDSPIRLARG
uniref:Ig-like domain-containing protein n=1 Tax=Amphilophus citrinellus TaxID=61819 RepID=A0A3Q0QTE7_AMPCI